MRAETSRASPSSSGADPLASQSSTARSACSAASPNWLRAYRALAASPCSRATSRRSKRSSCSRARRAKAAVSRWAEDPAASQAAAAALWATACSSAAATAWWTSREGSAPPTASAASTRRWWSIRRVDGSDSSTARLASSCRNRTRPWAATSIPRRSAGSRTDGSSTRDRTSQGSAPLGTTARRSSDDRHDTGSDENRARTAWRTDGGTAAPGAARTSVR